MATSIILTRDDDNQVPAEVDRRLTELVDRLVSTPRIHHANLAICSADGSRRWAAAAGPAESGRASIEPNTPFFIASVTKRFIITLVLQAHERGELDLDTRIVDVLPPEVTDGLHRRRGVDRTSVITVRHLASHTAGLPDYFDKPRSGGPSLFEQLRAGEDRSWTFEDVITWVREDHRPRFPPGDLTARRQAARYSDTGFQLLIRLIETVTGLSYGELLTDRIFGPANLDHTWLPGRTEPKALTPPPSQLYAKQRRMNLPDTIESSNDLISTTFDLLRFQRAVLDGALFRDQRTVHMLTERANRLRNIPLIRYGLGTMMFRVSRLASPGRRPLMLVGHSGATGTWLFHCPELDVDLTGTVDQTKGESAPFRVMAKMLRAWST